MSTPTKQPENKRVVLCYGAWILFFIVSVCMAVTATTLLVLDYNPRSASRATTKTVVTAETQLVWREHLLAQAPPSLHTAWRLPDSPESRALQWMLLHDDVHTSKSDELPSLQRFALIATYLHFGWTIPSREDECAWESIACNQDTAVIAFRPTTTLAVGTIIPTALTYLTHLQTLEVPRLGLQGQLPAQAHAWTDLRVLHLPGNHLTGVFLHDYKEDGETFYWSHLEHLDVSLNRLAETIPSRIRTAWTQLRVFNVRGNWNLRGNVLEMAIPHWLRTLERLELGETACGGSLPDSFVLDDTTEIPLEILAAAYTPIEGSSLPTTLGVAAPHLRILSLGLGNSLSSWVPGPIPASYATGLTSLEQVSLVDLRLTGTLPTTVAWPALRALDLYSNPNLTGTIPKAWGTDLPNVQIIRLVETGLTGTVPVEWGHMTKLTDLGLHRTGLTGRYAAAPTGPSPQSILPLLFYLPPAVYPMKFASFQI